MRANITPDEQFKKEIGSIRKTAEQEFIRALEKFHQRCIEHLQSKRTKVEQELSREKSETNAFQIRKRRTPSAPRDEHVHMSTDVFKLASNIQAKIDKFTQLLSKIDDSKNKQSESYPSVLSASKGRREKGTKRNTLTVRNYKRRALKYTLQQKKSRETIELRKQHIKNLSDTQLTPEQINLRSRGLKFNPTPVMKENQIRRQLFSDFNQFARRMRLQYIYHDQNTEQHPYHVKSSWIPPIQRSVALETYLEEVKIKLAETPLVKPKNNLPPGEQRALKDLINNKEIILKKADKGTTTVVMNRENKINEGQIQLDDRNNYQPLDKPMVRDTFQRVKHFIINNSLRQAGCIDEMTAKWFNQTPDPPRIPVFYTLTKILKPTLVGRPILSRCDGPTERLSSFVDKLLQPIAQIQESYLKDMTHFIRFIENTRVPRNAFLVSMDVTSLYTNIPQEEGITLVCNAYENFYAQKPPIATNCLREMLSLILKENSFQFHGKDYLQTHGTAMGTKMAVAFTNIFMASIEKEILRQSVNKPLTWKRFIDDVFCLWDTNEEEIEHFIEQANSYHPTIKFTCS